MQFQVPQFIDIEPKIIGPLTLKQFLMLVGAAGISLVLYFFLAFWLWAITSLVVAAIASGLAFLKYNGQSMLTVLRSALRFFWRPRFYVWKTKKTVSKPIGIPTIPKRGGDQKGLRHLLFQLTTSTKKIAHREHGMGLLSSREKKAKEKVQRLHKSSGENVSARRIDYR